MDPNIVVIRNWMVDKDDNTIVDTSAVAPAPNKDFYHVIVTPDEFRLDVWKIIPPHRGGLGKSDPMCYKSSFEDFPGDEVFLREIQRLGGDGMKDYLVNICKGRLDFLPRLPYKILEKVILYLNLEDISHMSRVSKQFRELCNSCRVWKQIYCRYCETPITYELEQLAEEKSWKRLFFTNKLQLQMQLRRMKHHPGDMPPPGPQAFITDQEEDIGMEEAQYQQQQQQQQMMF